MKHGFSLIEVLVAMFIASMLAIILFSVFFQSNRTVKIIDNIIDIDMQAVVATHQLEKDISGAFVPRSKKKQKKKEEEPPQEQKVEDSEPKFQEKKSPPQKPLQKIFYGVQKDNMFGLLTFISSNSLATYWSDRVGSARPKIVRVIYKLEEDSESEGDKKSYRLMRKESPHLDFKKAHEDQKNHSYELVSGIKSMDLEYISIEEDRDPENEQAPPKKSVQQSKVWNKEKEEQGEEGKTKKVKKIPNYVRVTFLLWDNQKESSQSFTVMIPIFAQPLPLQKKKKASIPAKKEAGDKESKDESKPVVGPAKDQSALDYTLSLIQGPKK